MDSRPPPPSPGMEWKQEGGSGLPPSPSFSGHGVEAGGWEWTPALPLLLRAWSGSRRVGVDSRPPPPSPGMEWKQEGGSGLPPSPSFSGHGVEAGGWEWTPALPLLLRAWSGSRRVGVDSRPPPPSPGMEWKQEGGSGLPPAPSFSGHGVEAGGWEWTPARPLLLRAWSGSRRVGVDSRPPPPSPGMEWKQEGGSGLPPAPSFSGHGVEAGGWEWTPARPLLLRAWSGSRRVGVDSRPPPPSPGMEWKQEGGSGLPPAPSFSGHGVEAGGWEWTPARPLLLRAWSGSRRVGVDSRPPPPSPGMEWKQEGGSGLPPAPSFSGHGVEAGGWEWTPARPLLLRAWSGSRRVGVDSRPPPPSPGMEWKQEGGSGLPPAPSFSGHGVEAGGWEWTPARPLLLRAWSGSRRVGVDSRPPPPSPGMEWKQEGGSGLPPAPSFSGHGVEAGGWEWTPARPLLLRAWSGSRRVGVDSRPPPPSPGMEWKQEGGSGLPPAPFFSGHGVEAGGWEWTPALPLLLRAWSGSRRVGVDSRPPPPSPGMEWKQEGGSGLPLFSHLVNNMTDTQKKYTRTQLEVACTLLAKRLGIFCSLITYITESVSESCKTFR